MATKKTRQKAAPVVANPLPTNDFGETVLNAETIELSKVPTTEVAVDELKPTVVTETQGAEGQSLESDVTPPEGALLELDGDTPATEDIASEEPLKLVVEGADETPVLGVTKAVEFDGKVTALQVEKEQNDLINRLQSKTVALADYSDEEDDPIVDVLCKRIDKHFSYIMGTSGFRDERQKVEQLVTFAEQLARMTKLETNRFYKVMDFIMTQMRTHGDALTPTTMFRFNIVTAKDHSAIMTRHNDFLNVCYKFAHNYADRNKLIAQIDFNKVCAGRTNKEAELFKSYFRKLAND